MTTYKMEEEIMILLCRIINALLWIYISSRRISSIFCILNIIIFNNYGIPKLSDCSPISQKNLIDVLLMDCPPELYPGPIDFDW